MNYINKILIKSLTFISSLVLLSASNAFATTITFDDLSGSGGTLSYDGGVNSGLVGNGIKFSDVTSNANGKSYSIDAILNIETGKYLENSSGIQVFDSGGSIEMTGTVYYQNGDVAIANQTLFSGSFEETSNFIGVSGAFSGFQIIDADSIILHEDLLSLLGFNKQYFSLAASIDSIFPDTIEIGANGSINVTVSSSDLTLRATGLPVSSTGSTVTMLGIGFAAFGFVRRNK